MNKLFHFSLIAIFIFSSNNQSKAFSIREIGPAKDKKRISVNVRKSGNDNPSEVIEIDFQNKLFKIDGIIESVIPIEDIQTIFGKSLIVFLDLNLIDDVTQKVYSYSATSNLFILMPTKSCLQCENTPTVYSYDWSISINYSHDENLAELDCTGFESFSYRLHASQVLFEPSGTLESIPTIPQHFQCNSTQSIWPDECFEYTMPGVRYLGKFTCETSESNLMLRRRNQYIANSDLPIYPDANSLKTNRIISFTEGQCHFSIKENDIQSITIVNTFGQIIRILNDNNSTRKVFHSLRLPNGRYYFIIDLKDKSRIVESLIIF